MYQISARIADYNKRVFVKARLSVDNGVITSIDCDDTVSDDSPVVIPGFIDAHVHIESSMLTPANFAAEAVRHGVVGVVTDPHEIANVLGKEGVRFMIGNSCNACFHFAFGVPSCVPATAFETSGASISSSEVASLLKLKEVVCLSEMMNFPGVLDGDPEVMAKIASAKSLDKPVDGHAPLLSGDPLKKYVAAGISTDHECQTLDEAKEKLSLGMNILIREGSAAKNFEALCPLIDSYTDKVMFCTDDTHPDDLECDYLDSLFRRAVDNGCDFWNVLQVASVNARRHYGLHIPEIKVGEKADFVVLSPDCHVLDTFIDGRQVFSASFDRVDVLRSTPVPSLPNNFHAHHVSPDDLRVMSRSDRQFIRVIECFDGQLFTKHIHVPQKSSADGVVLTDVDTDVLKIVVLDRYSSDAKPSVSFIRGFGLKHGAIAATVAHDSHNIIAVGVSDEAVAMAVNALVEAKGGIAVADGSSVSVLPLPVAGLMSDADCHSVSSRYRNLNRLVAGLGSGLHAPFMTLSFMALLVIPELKLSDRGLFDVQKFSPVSQFE